MAVTYTFAAIRAGLVANLSPLAVQSQGYVLASITAPSIEVFPGTVTYDEEGSRGGDMLEFFVRVTVAVTLDIAAQKRLDEYLAPVGTRSVKTLIESDPTLGGVVDDLRVTEATGYQTKELPGGGIALSCDWTLAIVA